ncbi:MAG: Tm-1-like ATP-binding domain-containing protein [Bacteroidota bacterium]
MREKTILIIGCFDTKGADFEYLYQCLVSHGLSIRTMNTGIMETAVQFPIDIPARDVALAAHTSLATLRKDKSRGNAVEAMGHGAAHIADELVSDGKIHGIIGMGGGGGTYIFLSAVQRVPLSIPKLCLSTLAGKDVSRALGSKDVLLMPSIVDVAGVNRLSKILMARVAAALTGMVQAKIPTDFANNKSIAISTFGNTTPCVAHCSDLLCRQDYEVLTFHAVGTGGRTMEELIDEGLFQGVLDVTTTELADELCGGICSAGQDRLTAAGKWGLPQVVAPGCLDMVNFGPPETVPKKYGGRRFFQWSPDVTLMRTNAEENAILGMQMAQKLNASKGKVAVLFPLRGLSKIGSEGGAFYDPEIDQVLFDTLRKNLAPRIPILEMDTHINDPIFAQRAVSELLAYM